MIEYRKRLTTQTVVLHDSHQVPGQTSDLKSWLLVEGRKRGLLGIGYHFVVGVDGSHMMTRPLDTVGNHTPAFNKTSIGICLEGGRRAIPGEDGETILVPADTFTAVQLETLRWLYATMIKPLYGELKVLGHSECGFHAWKHAGPCPATDMERLRDVLMASPLR